MLSHTLLIWEDPQLNPVIENLYLIPNRVLDKKLHSIMQAAHGYYINVIPVLPNEDSMSDKEFDQMLERINLGLTELLACLSKEISLPKTLDKKYHGMLAQYRVDAKTAHTKPIMRMVSRIVVSGMEH